MNAKDTESPAKTLSTHQKRTRTAHLRLKSTARPRVSTDYLSATPRGSEANKTVISDPPAARPSCRRTRASTADARPIVTTAAARNRCTAATPTNIVKADVSSDESTNSISISVDREMQTADNSSLEKSVHLDTYHFYLQRQDQQINAADVQTSLQSANSANKCRVIDNASTEKINIEETTASAKTCENKVHKHWFRRKQRQRAQETAKENRRP